MFPPFAAQLAVEYGYMPFLAYCLKKVPAFIPVNHPLRIETRVTTPQGEIRIEDKLLAIQSAHFAFA
jgi:hypothetical protein